MKLYCFYQNNCNSCNKQFISNLHSMFFLWWLWWYVFWLNIFSKISYKRYFKFKNLFSNLNFFFFYQRLPNRIISNENCIDPKASPNIKHTQIDNYCLSIIFIYVFRLHPLKYLIMYNVMHKSIKYSSNKYNTLLIY